VNRELEAKARGLAGWNGMSRHNLRARPIYHHERESIDAHLNVVFAALAVTRLIEVRTGWSIKKFIRTAHRYGSKRILWSGPDRRLGALRAGTPSLVGTSKMRIKISERCARRR